MVVKPESLTPHRYFITSHAVEDISEQDGFKKYEKMASLALGCVWTLVTTPM